MFNKKYDERLQDWRLFRQRLETVEDPLQDAVNYFKMAPEVSMQIDPYNPDNWPTPWEIIHENVYCNFSKILIICRTLQLTERFTDSKFEIHIKQSKQNSTIHYLLILENFCIGYDHSAPIHVSDLPDGLVTEMTHTASLII